MYDAKVCPNMGMQPVVKRDVYIGKETYIYIKRDLCIMGTQPVVKRDVYIGKETYIYKKETFVLWARSLLSKETCTYRKSHV